MKMGKKLMVVMVLAIILSCSICAYADPVITALKTEGMTAPLGIDTSCPEFSWQMQSDEIGAAQKSYQIVVRDASDAVVWDSGTVTGSDSVGILYDGETLKPASVYSWQVTVTDQNGRMLTSERAFFETSIMSDSQQAWRGAEWIGAGVLPLDAATKSTFHISADVQLQEGTDKVSFILGADDYRLKNPAFNCLLLNGENYVRVELDFSAASDEGGVCVNAYRCGYGGDTDAGTPFYTSKASEALDAVLTRKNQYDTHHLDIFCNDSDLTFTVDGVELAGDSAHVNPTGNLNTFPNMSCVGFAMNAGQSAVISNYTLSNGGRYARGTLLNQNTGATTQIFSGLDGITVNGNNITVNGGEQGILVYADPSWGAAPMLRTSFELQETAANARLYVSVKGICNFYINGQEVGAEDWFNPGAAQYDAILPYSIYDVTDLLNAGGNAMGAVLGEGWWTGMMTFEPLNNNYYGDEPALMVMLVVTYADGSSQTFVTDADNWQTYTDGPVRTASMLQGERYDAEKEAAVEGWCQPDFKVDGWDSAVVIADRPAMSSPKLVTRKDTPVHVIRTASAVSCLGEVKEGTGSVIYDMGENVSGVPLITIPAEMARPGETITLRFAEVLYPELEEYTAQGVNGMMMVENLRTAMVTDFYTMKEGENIFAPDLTFHGYRYIEITGLEGALPLDCVQMQVLSSLDITGSYESSNALVNQLFSNIVNSTVSNYLSIPTDCPQRDERMGWTGDAQVYCLSASYAADTYGFMRQWMDTVRTSCGSNGMSAQYAPAFVSYDPENDMQIRYKGMSFGITWNSLVVSIPYNLYMQTGDAAIVRDNYANACAYVDYLMSKPYKYKDQDNKKQEDPRLTNETGTLADHLSRVNTGGTSLGNALFIACLDQTAEMADLMGDSARSAHYRDAAAQARIAWNELFIDPETGMTRNTKGVIEDTQASYATPLRFGVISEENLPRVLAHYRRTIETPNAVDSDGLAVPPYSITTGFNATGNVLPALSRYGMSDIAYRLFESTEYASWLYPVTQGATSIWERWNGYTNELGFNGNNGMNSFNHYSFGACYEWMMAYQLGISPDTANPGYQHFIFQPIAGGSFTYAKGSYESAYGTIISGWTAENGIMTGWNGTVPANTTATLYLPVTGDTLVCDGAAAMGTTVRNGTDVTVIELSAGSWHAEIADGHITLSNVT